jgi:lipid-binding SYLF domain-containing protein
LLSAGPAFAQSKEERQQEALRTRAAATLDALFMEVRSSQALYDRAVGYAVFTVTKAGFFVTEGGGSGFIDGAIVYTLGEKGLMASADVSGARFWVDEKLN